MAQPLRREFAGVLSHLTSRGDRRDAMYDDEEDRETCLTVRAAVVDRYHWRCHAFCLMTNHYHLIIETHVGRSTAADLSG